MATSFETLLRRSDIVLARSGIGVLQVNLGKKCNQSCSHCHVGAGPRRTEQMDGKTIARVLHLLASSPSVHTLDITGGAPELNPGFRPLVEGARQLGRKVIDRCNLTVLLEQGQEGTARFLRGQAVEIVASLPCYTQANVDGQRGKGVFEKSIAALKALNALGYGKSGLPPELHLAYNPSGASLPPEQAKLERDYKARLMEDHGIEFNRLYTMTNMPIDRFERHLARTGARERYLSLLANNFNRQAATAVMCRTLVSVGWDGALYDCDFNQALDLPLAAGGGEEGNGPAGKRTVWEIDSLEVLLGGRIAVADHCYGCTAGTGSSCGGALAGAADTPRCGEKPGGAC